jgi:cryptochrome
MVYYEFKNSLRTQDNPSFNEALGEDELTPIFIMPKQSPNQLAFLAGCLRSLKADLKKIGLDLFIVKSRPKGKCLKESENAILDGVYKSFISTEKAITNVPQPIPVSKSRPKLKKIASIPLDSIKDLSRGGRKEALKHLQAFASKMKGFVKQDTIPNQVQPSTSMLSPYLSHGCISAREAWHFISRHCKSRTQSSFLGQLIWREFFYSQARGEPNYSAWNNPNCRKPLPYKLTAAKKKHLQAWKFGKTGYPYIDAIMRQLRQEGWIHHLARHAVACFLTRGGLGIHWAHGRDVFDEWLIDRDYAMNNGNWMWVSGVRYFNATYRIYSPEKAFGADRHAKEKGYKANSVAFIRKFVPELAECEDEFIYTPWKSDKKFRYADRIC